MTRPRTASSGITETAIPCSQRSMQLEDIPALVEGLKAPGGVAAQPSLAAKVLPRADRGS